MTCSPSGFWTMLWRAGLLAGLLVMTASCDGDTLIEPFENEDRFFTVYGFIDQLASTHQLRVIPVMKFPEVIEAPDDPQANLDAEVFLTNLNTGARRQWVHALEHLDDGTYAHVFRTQNYTVLPGHTYRLEVRRSDGTMASAETKVPNFADFAPPVVGAVRQAETDTLLQDVLLPNLPSPWDIRVRYHVPTGGREYRVPVPYERAGTRTDDGGWRFTINLTRDAQAVRDTLNNRFGTPERPWILVGMSVLVRVLDEQWNPPEGVFDPETLAQPGTLSNVENGYGFFGAVGVYLPADWPVSRELAAALGFR